MQILINIHERDYYSVMNGYLTTGVLYAVQNGKLLPEEHGCLIDADELLKIAEHEGSYGYVSTVEIMRSPVIIERNTYADSN